MFLCAFLRMREALTYLAHAYESNTTLLKNGEKRGMEQSVIAVYRRKCLTVSVTGDRKSHSSGRGRLTCSSLHSLPATQALNEKASRLFCSGSESSVEEGTAIMDEVVIPCLHLMSRDPALCQEDQDAMESIRNHWCCCLSQDMDGKL